ncbi:MAG: TetR/AcrR family transcriptional regulator [Trueperaceae bacterium]|nr:TetR/AcrR family transcriptional regulator [Trueperaceae bacterium]
MPLPRFLRLDEAERSRILMSAAEQLATTDYSEVSMERIASAAGISRSAMYNYFDGREDLVAAVREHAVSLARAALGEWVRTEQERDFWQSFSAAEERLRAFLAANPALRSALASRGDQGSHDEWVDALVANAAELGLVPIGRELLAAAVTSGLLAALDSLELQKPGAVPDRAGKFLLLAAWAALDKVATPKA